MDFVNSRLGSGLKTSNHGTSFHFHATAMIEIKMDSVNLRLGDDLKKRASDGDLYI